MIMSKGQNYIQMTVSGDKDEARKDKKKLR